MSIKPYFMKPSDLEHVDKAFLKRLKLKPPRRNEFPINGTKVVVITSEGRYTDEHGQEFEFFFQGPRQQSFGPSYIHEIKIDEKDRTPLNAEGMQLHYPICSRDTFERNTAAEKGFKMIVDHMRQLTYKQAMELSEIEGDECAVPSNKRRGMRGAPMDEVVKPPYSFPKDKVTNKPDTSRPPNMYIKLDSSGKKEKMKVKTKFHLPGNKVKLAPDLVGVRGNISPVIKWEGVYWGGHGDKTYSASVKLRVMESTFTACGAEEFKSLMDANEDEEVDEALYTKKDRKEGESKSDTEDDGVDVFDAQERTKSAQDSLNRLKTKFSKLSSGDSDSETEPEPKPIKKKLAALEEDDDEPVRSKPAAKPKKVVKKLAPPEEEPQEEEEEPKPKPKVKKIVKKVVKRAEVE